MSDIANPDSPKSTQLPSTDAPRTLVAFSMVPLHKALPLVFPPPGQDILAVDKWLKDNPDKRALVMDLDYFDMNGELFGISTGRPRPLQKDASIDEIRETLTETQWWIISVKRLYNSPGSKGLEYLQQIEPVDRIAYAYHVYRIDPK